MAYLIPNPSQEGQAPLGELKEKDKGSKGSKDILQAKHAMCSE